MTNKTEQAAIDSIDSARITYFSPHVNRSSGERFRVRTTWASPAPDGRRSEPNAHFDGGLDEPSNDCHHESRAGGLLET